MIRRHPWVFGDMHVDTPEEGEKLWEEIEHIREAEGRKLSKDELDAVSAGFGFDFPSGCTLFFSA